MTDSLCMETAERADPRGPTDDAPPTLPFTIEADLDLGAALGSHGYPLFTDDVLLVGPASFDAGPLCHGHHTLSLDRKGLALSGVEVAASAPQAVSMLRMKQGRRSLKWYAVPARQARQRTGRLRRLYFPSYRSNVPGQPPCRVERRAGRVPDGDA